MDRQRARTCPAGSDTGDTGPDGDSNALLHRVPGLLILVIAVVGALWGPAGPVAASAEPTRPAPAVTLAAGTPALVLLSQTSWITPGQVFDVHLESSAAAGPVAQLGVTVSVYPCLSSVSGFDQSLGASPAGTPDSSTTSPLPVSSLAALPGGGFDLPMPVVVGGSASGATAPSSPFTIHLQAVGGQCQSFPAGVYPVRIQLVDLSGSAVVGSFTTHLVVSQAPADTQRLRVAVVVPVQVTQQAARSPGAAELLARPGAALATPPVAAVSAVAATVAAVAAHPAVPVTLQVSAQTVTLLASDGHQATVAQLAQLASTPAVHELSDAPFTPVDAMSLVDAGLGGELALQVARGGEVLAAATGRAAPVGTVGSGAWITGDGVDGSTVAALAGDGFSQLVLPATDMSSTPSQGSTAEPFSLSAVRGTPVTAMASDPDLTLRYAADPGNPVLAAHQLAAELAQLYYERPNGISPRAVLAVAPTSWDDDPAFVDALLGALDGNPLVQAMTTSQVFSLFPVPATCRTGCRLTPSGTTPPLPVTAIRLQRSRVAGFADSAVGARPLVLELGDLVLAAETQTLRPAQQSAVLDNAGAAVDAQVGQVAVEGQPITLTASSGLVPVTVVSAAPYPLTTNLELSSDKLLFPNGETQWSTTVTLLPRHSNVVYVRVRSRTSGVFRLDIALHSPDGALRIVTGELSVRSTSSSVVGVVLTVGAVVVLAVWWFRTSRRRRAQQRADEAGHGPRGPDGGPDQPLSGVGAGPGVDAPAAP